MPSAAIERIVVSMRRVVLLGALWGCAGTDGARGPGPSTFGDSADSSTSGASATSMMATSDDPLACVPGMQVECACAGGMMGAQACNEDGSGFLPCECPMDATSDGPTTGTTGAGTESGGTTSGPPGMCDPTWNCGDCSVCNDCMECEGCVSCAAVFDCAEEYDACVADPACEDAIACSTECGSTGSCAMMCTPADPSGDLFTDLTNCMAQICLSHCGL